MLLHHCYFILFPGPNLWKLMFLFHLISSNLKLPKMRSMLEMITPNRFFKLSEPGASNVRVLKVSVPKERTIDAHTKLKLRTVLQPIYMGYQVNRDKTRERSF